MKWVLNVRNRELATPGLWVMDLESRKAVDGECLEGHKLQEDLGVNTCAPAWIGCTLVMASCCLLMLRTQRSL